MCECVIWIALITNKCELSEFCIQDNQNNSIDMKLFPLQHCEPCPYQQEVRAGRGDDDGHGQAGSWSDYLEREDDL